MNQLAPLSHGHFVANDPIANISDLNQRLDVCLNKYSVIFIGVFSRWQTLLTVIDYMQASIRKCKDASFFSEARGVDAKYSTFTAVAGDQHNVYSNSVAWMPVTFVAVVVCLFSLILQLWTIVSSQVNCQFLHKYGAV